MNTPPPMDPIEKKAETLIEEKYLLDEKRKLCILLEDVEINWFWEEQELELFDRLWKMGLGLWDIAERMDAEHHEALIMMIDRVARKKIKQRKGGINGTVSQER